jgi:hypothetical protein
VIAELAAAFLAGAVSHKLWRVAWRTVRYPVGFRAAITDEFAPPMPEPADKSRRRASRVSEVV